MAAMNPARSLCVGRRPPPGGGMSPPRNLRKAFSQVAASLPTFSGLIASNASPAVSSVELWQS